MRWSWFLVAVVTMACKNVPAPDPLNPDVPAEVPDWIAGEVAGQEEACATAPYWDEANIATNFFAGNYAFDGEGVLGQEFWLLYPNANLTANTGFQPCQVVWDVVGVIGDPVQAGSYSLSISATVDEDQTDCVEDVNSNPVYAGDEQFSVTYDVFDANGSVTVVFGNSGNPVGIGESTNRGISWLSDYDCKYF